MFDTVPAGRFLPLPKPRDAEGQPRCTGVEIELGGLDARAAADCAREVLGGHVDEGECPKSLRLSGSRIGDLDIYLDTGLRKKAHGRLAELGLDLASAVVPVELVTGPLAPDQMPVLDELREALCAAGAEGSRHGVLFGFGVHFNPQVASLDLPGLLPVLTAFALCEDALRAAMQIDISRRVLPFVQAYPRALADALAGDAPETLDALIGLYLDITPSRNRGLDMLPAFAMVQPERVHEAAGDAVSARPTFHYRLPDCRIDETGWSLATEWNRWVLIERIAARPQLLAALAAAWQEHRASWSLLDGDWAANSARIVAEGLEVPA